MASYQTEPDTCSGGSWKFAWEVCPALAIKIYDSDPRAAPVYVLTYLPILKYFVHTFKFPFLVLIR